MIRKKVTLLGASAVGKTSLVRRYVHGRFSDIYRTTIGVQIHSKRVEWSGGPVELLLWDLEGEDAFAQVQLSYLGGTSAYLLVADGTRAATLDAALEIDERVRRALGELPRTVVINKLDLFEQWEVSDRDIRRLLARGIDVQRCSAKSGAGVEALFTSLLSAALGSQRGVDLPGAP